MKKLIITTLLLALSLYTFSQNCIGCTASDLSSDGATFIKTEDGFTHYKKITDSGLWLYSIPFKYNYVTDLIHIPYKEDLHVFITVFNENYVKISNTSWRLYLSDNIIDVTLLYDQDDGYYFMYNKIIK
jgi:hypothetical protein